MTFYRAKALNQLVIRGSVFGPLIRAYYRLNRLQIRVKTFAIQIRNGLGLTTLVIHLIHVVPAFLVLERHLRIM